MDLKVHACVCFSGGGGPPNWKNMGEKELMEMGIGEGTRMQVLKIRRGEEEGTTEKRGQRRAGEGGGMRTNYNAAHV